MKKKYFILKKVLFNIFFVYIIIKSFRLNFYINAIVIHKLIFYNVEIIIFNTKFTNYNTNIIKL